MLNGTASLQHISACPDSTTAAQGIALLHDHEFFIQCDPHMIKYEKMAQQPPLPLPIPEARSRSAISEPVRYQVTDKVHALPAGLWDSEISSHYEFINIDQGVFVRIRSPMGITMETVWEVREGDDGALQLVEDIVIKCPRPLMSVMKNTCESGWKEVHGKMVNKLKES